MQTLERRLMALVAITLGSMAVTASALADFVDVTTPPLDDPGPSIATAWWDYEHDGDLDLYVSNHHGVDKVYRNDGDSHFTDVTTSPFGLADGNTLPAFGDADRDGDLDLYLATHVGRNWLLRNDGNGTYHDVTSASGLPTEVPDWGYTSHFIDYDEDGDLDLFAIDQPAGLQNRLFQNQGDGSFSDATIAPIDSPEGSSRPDAWGDFDNDGDLDLYLGKLSGANRLFRNHGGGQFEDVTPLTLADTDKTNWAEWLDFDNDGDLDLSVSNADNFSPILYPNRLFRNDGDLEFVDVAEGTLLEALGWGGSTFWADFDNDGDLDALVTRFEQDARLLRNDGPVVALWPDVALGTTLAAAGRDSCLWSAWGDYDQDGDLDLYLPRWNARNYLFRNDLSSGYHWLDVRLVGTNSNSSGIGTRVRLVAGGQSQIRELIAPAQPIHFGLATAATIDTIQVRWPSGLMEQVVSPAWLNEEITWIEGQTVAVLGNMHPAPAVWLHQNRPNPFNPMTRITFDLPFPGQTSLRIYDASGHIVRTLVDGMLAANVHDIAWDGRDDRGRRLGSGVYFYRLQTGDTTLSRKLIMVE